MAHTILLVQPGIKPETRTYSDYESVGLVMVLDGGGSIGKCAVLPIPDCDIFKDFFGTCSHSFCKITKKQKP